MNRFRTMGYSLIGGGGALGTLLTGRGCIGSCAGCYSCFAVPGLIIGLAFYKSLQRNIKGEENGLVAGDH